MPPDTDLKMQKFFEQLPRLNKAAGFVFYSGLALALLPFLLLAAYNFPSGHDDINNAVEVMNKGSWGAFRYFYKAWTGRYTLIWLCAWFNPMLYKNWLWGIRLAPIVHLILVAGSAGYFIRSVWREITYWKALVFGCFFLALYLFAIPSVADVFYWVTGAFTYAYGLIFFLVAAGSAVNYISAGNSLAKLFYLFLAAFFLVAAIGTNESCLLACLLVSGVVCAAAFLRRSPFKYGLLVLLICALAASIFSVTAPGNAIRSGAIGNPALVFNSRALASALAHSLLYTALNVVNWANSLVLLIASVLFIPFGLKLLKTNSWLRAAVGFQPLACLTITLFFLAAQTFPSFLCKYFVDDRVWSSVYFFFLLSWFYNALVLIRYFEEYLSKFDFRKIAWLKFGLVLLLLFSGGGNISRAYTDLVLRAPAFAKSLEKRYEQIAAAKNQDLVVPPIFDLTYQYPLTIYSTDISTETDNYRNTSVSEYFGLKSIRLKNEPTKYP